jgi:hypothetical protein
MLPAIVTYLGDLQRTGLGLASKPSRVERVGRDAEFVENCVLADRLRHAMACSLHADVSDPSMPV